MLVYIIPEYIDRVGDCSRICTENDKSILQKKVSAILKGIFRDACVDFNLVKRKYSRILNQKNLIPLYLESGELLIPVKVRVPRTARDSGYGYINLNFIEKLENKNIILRDGEKIFYLDSERIIIKRMKMARMLEERLKEKERDALSSRMESFIPASRADIKSILMELESIKTAMVRIV